MTSEINGNGRLPEGWTRVDPNVPFRHTPIAWVDVAHLAAKTEIADITREPIYRKIVDTFANGHVPQLAPHGCNALHRRIADMIGAALLKPDALGRLVADVNRRAVQGVSLEPAAQYERLQAHFGDTVLCLGDGRDGARMPFCVGESGFTPVG